MKTLISLGRLVAAAGLLAGLAATASADAFDEYFADIAILQLKPVQKEIGVTEAQRKAMNTHAAWLDTQTRSIDAKVKAGTLKPADANKQMAGHLATLKKKVLGELTSAQIVRLREITLQRDGLLPLLDQKMAEKIGLTDAQLKKLRDGYVDSDKRAKEVQSKAFKPIFDKYNAMKPKSDEEKKRLAEQADKELNAAKKKIQPQMEQIGKDVAKLVEQTLTQGQKDAFAKLKGKPFVPKED